MRLKLSAKSLFKIVFSSLAFPLALSILSFVLSSCASANISSKHTAITGYEYKNITTHQEVLDLSNLEYTKIANGIFIARVEAEKLPLIATIAKIDLTEKNLRIVATEEERFRLAKKKKSSHSSHPSLEVLVAPETTQSFATRHSTNLAINANFFNFKTFFFDKFYKPLGLFLNNGKLLSPAKKDFASIIFDETNKAKISEDLCENTRFAIAGYNKVIEQGRVILQGKYKRKDSRSLIGVNESGDTLFILLIDGERKVLSEGLALIDAARLFVQVGVFEGIELDGGGSSTLVVKIEGLQHQLVPSSKKQKRRVAVNLGFISQ